jgi:tetratricopeptide (TPR) repeat protein
VDVLLRLAYLDQAHGHAETAERYYEQIVAHDPGRAIAAANLGVFYVRRGRVRETLDMWRNAFDRNPQLSELGVNLSRLLCDTGDADEARAVLQRVLKHNRISNCGLRSADCEFIDDRIRNQSASAILNPQFGLLAAADVHLRREAVGA